MGMKKGELGGTLLGAFALVSVAATVLPDFEPVEKKASVKEEKFTYGRINKDVNSGKRPDPFAATLFR